MEEKVNKSKSANSIAKSSTRQTRWIRPGGTKRRKAREGHNGEDGPKSQMGVNWDQARGDKKEKSKRRTRWRRWAKITLN